MSLTLRDYQGQAIEDLRSRFAAGAVRVPMVLATGLGKTVIFTHPTLLNDYLDAGRRVLIIAHSDELIEQAARKARQANPGRRVGIVKAEQNQTTAQIIVSSRQTLASQKRRAAIRNVGLIIIDEAHHAVRTNTYGKILEHFGAFGYPDLGECTTDACVADLCREHRPHPHVAGFTATLARGDKAKLSSVWEELSFRRDILFGIRRGSLLDVTGHRVTVPDMDLRNVKTVAGDYGDRSLADELERTFAPEVVAKAYLEHAAGRKGIAFWPLVETAEHGAKAFNDAGIRSEVIHGKLLKAERRAMLKRLHTGETQVLHGVAVLTEGFDDETVDVVVIARPTRSAPLFQQMVGRALRPNLELPPAERGKAMLLDVVGAGAAHDLRSLVDLSPERPLRQDEDGELSLLELDDFLLEEEEERRAGATFEFDTVEDYRGPVEVQLFDPLGRSQVWGKTAGGTWFMSAGGEAYVFLVPSLAGDPAHWDVVSCSKKAGSAAWARGTDITDAPLDEALMWGENTAEDIGGYGHKTLTGRKSAWRRGAVVEGSAQQNLGKRMGVWRDGMTKGELSEAIDVKFASSRIDVLVKRVAATVD